MSDARGYQARRIACKQAPTEAHGIYGRQVEDLPCPKKKAPGHAAGRLEIDPLRAG
jgi:hypothetical protein